jgi:hypothetical protein
MTPAPAGSEPGGFELGPEIWLLLLGVVATLVVFGIFIWLIRQQIKQEKAISRDEIAGTEEPGSHHD